ncbi:helix-turn-helix transcriptional regulator [Variovorax sp. OV329]|uniref:ATP-binding protein n=1 Tax=Variovorax sp. OV329 TaxID=1882825 RepID=UPI0008DFE03F|nr:helix-turn-helix transcriptional regulator [Variovorax sp. OV329]SFM68603.1 Predicted ATPase [Variovorax sp. OV329]
MLADSTNTQANGEVLWRFGSFVLWESQRRLERRGQSIRLGSRSFDLLLQLLKRAGEVISNEEFLAAVWSGVVVEEASVRVHMSNLRKALGTPDPIDDCREWIANVPLRGYRFVGRVACEAVQAGVMPATQRTAPQACEFARIPARLSRLIGRNAEVGRVIEALASRRLVTVVGSGGIGKTSVAIDVAMRQQASAPGLVGFVDLAPLHSADPVICAIACALGTAPDAPEPLQAIVQRLAGREVLLLVDSCEHVIEPLSRVLIQLLAALPSLRILATSREALRIEGEHVLRLTPLALPEGEPASLEEAMCSPAVELLVERAWAAGATAFEDCHRAMLARICRRMDGIPLAIELVAARLGAQAIADLVHRMDDPMRLYWTGTRAAIPRHRSLAAALDWSVALLNETELKLFRRLSVYSSRFDVDSALVLTADDMDPERATDALISLATKSLVVFDPEHAGKPYRLLDTTRNYAQLLLAQSKENHAMPSRHPGPPSPSPPLLAARVRLPESASGPKISFWPQWSWMDLSPHSLVLAP